jgi:8-oxo-dGTP diphosphatase
LSHGPFLFCPYCGGKLDPTGIRPRCSSCGFVHYRNPIVGVAAIIMDQGNILLGRRAKKSSRPGLWCIPCGYVEYDEEIRDALRREALEETGLEVEPGDVFAVHSNFHDLERQTVGVWFCTKVVGGTLRPGDDIDQLAYVPPWNPGVPLAFPTDSRVLGELARIG